LVGADLSACASTDEFGNRQPLKTCAYPGNAPIFFTATVYISHDALKTRACPSNAEEIYVLVCLLCSGFSKFIAVPAGRPEPPDISLGSLA
jgi:hypothetical protein